MNLVVDIYLAVIFSCGWRVNDNIQFLFYQLCLVQHNDWLVSSFQQQANCSADTSLHAVPVDRPVLPCRHTHSLKVIYMLELCIAFFALLCVNMCLHTDAPLCMCVCVCVQIWITPAKCFYPLTMLVRLLSWVLISTTYLHLGRVTWLWVTFVQWLLMLLILDWKARQCIGLLHTVRSAKRMKENESVFSLYNNFCSSFHQSSFYQSASMQPQYNHDQNVRPFVRHVNCDKMKAPSEKFDYDE